jgi:RNA polymerase sigma-70 factor (ECF subfamily)
VHYPKEHLNWGLIPAIAIFRRAPILDSNELLVRLRRGDEAAFDAIFRRWYPSLVRAAESLVRSRAVAEELVQDVMLELWKRRETLAEESSPQAYLFQATRNRALNHIRHARIERLGEPHASRPEAVDSTAHSLVVEEEMLVAVKKAVDRLPDRCREVFELSRTHGLKYSEIATALGISIKTVEAQMGKALKTLREELAPWVDRRDHRA